MPSGVVIRRKYIAISVKLWRQTRPRKDLISSIVPIWQIGAFLKRKDLTGQRFGKLVVKKMIYGEVRRGRKRTVCGCDCDCGNYKEIVMDDITFGGRRSCGCDSSERRSINNRKDLTGKRFGRLVVTDMDWSQRPTKATCLCDCGNTVNVSSADLSYGHTQSCGCLQKERASQSNVKDWSGTVSPSGVELIKQDHKNAKGQWLWACRCGFCGSDFIALPAKIMNGHIISCGCKHMSSKEKIIEDILISLQVDYTKQYSIPGCKYKYKLKFDFAVFMDSEVFVLIEYDGEQHFRPVSHWGGEDAFLKSQERDTIKDDFCKENNIRLLRLPYTMTNEEIQKTIEDIIYP